MASSANSGSSLLQAAHEMSGVAGVRSPQSAVPTDLLGEPLSDTSEYVDAFRKVGY
jgi:hypothetical protein